MQDFEYEVRELIFEEREFELHELKSDARLFHDLGIDGDDGVELLEAFAKRFEVDMTDLDISKHFGPEVGFDPINYLFTYFFRLDKLKFVPITISDLVISAKSKRWIAPDREPEL